MLRRPYLLILSACWLLGACQRGPEPAKAKPIPAPAEAKVPDNRPVILAFGDSLTAGHGVELTDAYPSMLQRELDRLGYTYHVVNGGVSGDTTSGGLSRIDFFLGSHPKIVILELGGNDGLRGLPIRDARSNLEEMIRKSQAAGSEVVLAGMTLPRNLGSDYIREFEGMYSGLAKEYHLSLIPFFLEGVAGNPQLNQEDGIHPTTAGYVIVTKTVLKALLPLLKR